MIIWGQNMQWKTFDSFVWKYFQPNWLWQKLFHSNVMFERTFSKTNSRPEIKLKLMYIYIHFCDFIDVNECDASHSPVLHNCNTTVGHVKCVNTEGSFRCDCLNTSYVQIQPTICIGKQQCHNNSNCNN